MPHSSALPASKPETHKAALAPAPNTIKDEMEGSEMKGAFGVMEMEKEETGKGKEVESEGDDVAGRMFLFSLF